MAVDANRLGTGRRVAPDARAAREKKQKIMLGVGLTLLVGLGALQGPKTLRQLRGSQTSASPAAASPAGSTAGAPAAAPVSHAALQALRRFPQKDPFVVQVGSPSPASPGAIDARPPAVRRSHYVSKDPFVPQATALGGAAPAPLPATTPIRSGRGGYIVVLESISLADGRGEARSAVAVARKAGLHAAVLDSTKYATLRSGYLAVYTGPYSTVDQVLRALSAARSHGYVAAYARRLRG